MKETEANFHIMYVTPIGIDWYHDEEQQREENMIQGKYITVALQFASEDK